MPDRSRQHDRTFALCGSTRRIPLTTGGFQSSLVAAKSFTGKEKDWLGGLDSNQDSQIQSLESYQLDDLPADGSLVGKWQKLG